MKKLELEKMESIQGGLSQRNCSVLGVIIVGSAIAGVFSGGAAWWATATAVGAAASGDCF